MNSMPAQDTPEIKVVCIGHLPYFGVHMPNSTGNISVMQLEFHHGDSSSVFNNIEKFKPQVLLAFRPELVPSSILMGFSGLKIGFSSEIFPKVATHADPLHEGKFNFFLGSQLNFYDYMLHYDVASKEYLEHKGVFMSEFPPYPINDLLFEDVAIKRDIDVLFIGRISKRRYQALEKLKKRKIRLVSIDHGLFGDDIINLLRRAKVVLNIHAEQHVSFEPRVLIGGAVGACVVTEEINIPEWLPKPPFKIIDLEHEGWVEVIESALLQFDYLSQERDLFRDDLRALCSANKFLEALLIRARNGGIRKFRMHS